MSVKNILNNLDVINHKFAQSEFKEWSIAPATTKGKIGEDVAQQILKDNGFKVSNRVSKEHDAVVDDKKVEIKTAFEKKSSNEFVVYGIDATEDWHWTLIQLVTPTTIYGFKLDRKMLGDIYLGKTRRNTMFTTTLADMRVIAEEVYEYAPKKVAA